MIPYANCIEMKDECERQRLLLVYYHLGTTLIRPHASTDQINNSLHINSPSWTSYSEAQMISCVCKNKI